jgi:hypothetical protein
MPVFQRVSFFSSSRLPISYTAQMEYGFFYYYSMQNSPTTYYRTNWILYYKNKI